MSEDWKTSKITHYKVHLFVKFNSKTASVNRTAKKLATQLTEFCFKKIDGLEYRKSNYSYWQSK